MTQYLPEPWERDAILEAADKAADWLVICPRDGSPLIMQDDCTERCEECGWHTGDDLLTPEVTADLERWRAVRRAVIAFPFGVAFSIAMLRVGMGADGYGWPVALVIGVILSAVMCAVMIVEAQPDPKPAAQSRTHRALPPPPQGHRFPPPPPGTRLPAVCSVCGGASDVHTSGWCSNCKTYASSRNYDRPKKPTFKDLQKLCAVCHQPTNSTSGECPNCEVHDGNWSYQQARNERQIIASFSVPPLIGPVAMSGGKLPYAKLGTSMTSTDTVLLLDRPAPWREGALVEVVIDPGRTCEERVLVAPQGPTLLVQCRGYDDSTAQPHSAGAEVRVVRATKRLRSI